MTKRVGELSMARGERNFIQAQLKREFGPLSWRLSSRFFKHVRFSATALSELRHLYQTGYVVHVMRTTAWVNYLYLSWAMLVHSMPPVRAVANLRRWFTRPFSRCHLSGPIEERFQKAFLQGGCGMVFLRETVLGKAEGTVVREDPFPALVELSKQLDKPIFLVPELFVWEKSAQKISPGFWDHVFGAPEHPGFLHSLGAFLTNFHRAQFRVGEPINLSAFVQGADTEKLPLLAHKVRGVLNVHLARETRAVFGPPIKSRERLLRETVRDRDFCNRLSNIAQEQSKSIESAQKEANRALRSIAAKQNSTVLALAAPLMSLVFHRIYDGIEVDEAGLEKAMKVATKTPVVLVPSHKSHVDYLVMSFVLWQRGYSAPLVAAGANLSFFPLGTFLRRCGGFFLRRSFRGDKIYAAAFRAYLKKLVQDGITHEFFPEGGRSRNGKLLVPKMGLFSWLVDAVLEGAREDLHFIPVAIDYERVVELSSYSAELKGKTKKNEDIGRLLASSKVLTKRYGSIHLRFGNPISLAQLMQERHIQRSAIQETQKTALVQTLASKVMHAISQASTITPHALLATALLAHQKRGLLGDEIAERIGCLRHLAAHMGAPLSTSLNNAPSSPCVLGPIEETMHRFVAEKSVRVAQTENNTIFQVQEEKRLELSFNKNSLLNWFASHSMLALAIQSNNGEPTLKQVNQRAAFLSSLFQFEFVSHPKPDFHAEWVGFQKLGLLSIVDKNYVLTTEEFAVLRLEFLANLLRDYLESYRLAALAIQTMEKNSSVDSKELLKKAIALGQANLLLGKLTMAEALSKPNLENAIRYLAQEKFIEANGKEWRFLRDLHEFELQLRSYV
ncbi:MAG: 1-acyl-sn-glycerol-3-phosphate acyltransferase [Proteobacteria bacterium]|nr:1-acyl-sn-glycerol-3-phosphate acyltransferase [Cystobacterineae bacterium]MCL2314896.1 1-acyl-sn-glycerol-3-phosphate acyltransferase [Pseudomonadota bacterium]